MVEAGVEQERVVAALRAIEQNPVWYHTLELAPGVLTPGQIDLRRVADKLLPADLHGRRALDVGTFDGFWAFELERRGAEVVAIDVAQVDAAEWPPNNRARLEREAEAMDIQLGRGFELAASVLASAAQRVVCDVRELTPEAIGGQVDLAFMGALLLHLRDPVRALERIFDVLRPGAVLYQVEPVSLRLSLAHPRRALAELQTLTTPFNWWLPNRAALRGWVRTAGFVEIRSFGLRRPPQRKPMDNWFELLRCRRP